ncbi:MAG TPA: VWA domain-containing protein [Acidobacteriaceae bacterium]|nr:VWA domain-containing protein [Acidobacteriaceae bacterium]
MSSGSRLLVSLALCAGMAFAQQPATATPSASAQQQPQSPPLLPTLHAGTQLVIVDVVVQDRNGRPVHGLTRNNFIVTEQKKPQVIKNFDEHTAAASDKPGPPMPRLPAGTFTDYTPVPPDSTLNVLLIDRLNTPMKDQAFVRQQLVDYVKHERPGTRVAIFGLTSRLYMLQGFTSDPQVLRDVVEHHLLPRGSPLLDDPTGNNMETTNPSDMAADLAASTGSADIAQAAASMQQFEAETQAFQTQFRTEYTLDAFNALAHYLSNFPGRKNVIWFSGSFPMNIEPDPNLNDPFAVMADSNAEFRETTNLLTHSQVAVYPVDARGLMTPPMFDASSSGRKYVRNPNAFNNDLRKFAQSQAAEHFTMEQMASDTGGHAFYNTNGLADAVGKAIDSGSNYYTMTYSPEDHNWNGAYRSIRVDLAGQYAALGLKLSYRHGYYADDPERPHKGNGAATVDAVPAATLADRAAAAYSRAAATRGGPTPTDIIFTASVRPTGPADSDKLPADNEPDPHGSMKAPYRNFMIEYKAMARVFSVTSAPDGNHKGQIEFDALVYDTDGRLLNGISKSVMMNLTPETYKKFIAGAVAFRLEIGTPAREQTFLRLMIRDVPSNRYGVVEIPTAQVARLPPLEPPPVIQGAPASAGRPSAANPAASAAAGAASSAKQ